MTVRKGRKAPKQTNQPSSSLQLEDFRYADELGMILPQLVLAIEIPKRGFDEDARTLQFKPERTWIKLAHQTAGHACSQHYLLGCILKLKNGPAAKELAGKWFGSNLGMFGASLDQVIEYRQDIKRLFGVDCNFSWKGLEEGFMPIDIDYLSQIALDYPKEPLDDLIEWQSGWQRSMGAINRWGLWILSENSN